MLTPRPSNKLLINHKAKLVAALDNAEAYRGLAVRAKDRAGVNPTSVSRSGAWRSLRKLTD